MGNVIHWSDVAWSVDYTALINIFSDNFSLFKSLQLLNCYNQC